MTTQILICENQTIWKLEILLRTIVAALLKTKCNGCLKTKGIKKRAKNISQQCKWSWKMRVTNILLLKQHWCLIMAHPRPPPPPHLHTHQKDTVCLMNSAHPTSSPHNLISNSYHDKCTSFLITQLPKKEKKIYSISLGISPKPNSIVAIFNKSKISIQTKAITWMSWLQEHFEFTIKKCEIMVMVTSSMRLFCNRLLGGTNQNTCVT